MPKAPFGYRPSILTAIAQLVILCCLLVPVTARSLDVITVSAGDAANGTKPLLKYSLLKAALESTVKDYGPYELNALEISMNGHRGILELQHGKVINIYFALTRTTFEEKAIPIPIPARRGLVSYRVLLVNRDEQELFKGIESIDQLKTLSTGADPTWATYAVLKHHNFNMVNVRNYTSLFDMLARKRFKYVIRTVNEVEAEIEHYGKPPYNLVIEPNILLYIPSANYIFVSKKHPRIAQRLEAGLQILVDNGQYEKMFHEHFGDLIKKIDFDSRTLIEIHNPTLPQSVPTENPILWLRPNTQNKRNTHPNTEM